MTDVAVRDDNAPAQQQPAQPVYQASPLVQWAYEAKQAHQIAQSLSTTSFVPASLRGKPQDITAAILAGQELGLQPMATLRSLDVIQGTPALRAHAMRGLVQAQGHSIQLVDSTDKSCTIRGRRKGEDEWQEVTWTIEQAQQLGLLSKDQWKKQPKNMLIARCTGAICRLIASDVLYAMPYASEELGDDGMDTAPVRAMARVNASEVLANAAAAREQAKPISGPPAQQAQQDVPAEPEQHPVAGWDDDSAWDDVDVVQPAGGAQ
ncbi:hypothetical protein [Actinoplanes rectilineatus]|uniref:hypothetical protein n=1 Tax=Actinoplanes rectilineatus TaxID=113571 RepID=UPI0005F2EEE7|nr:hypothetical protein [Actinoplanes rectilineatus]